MMQKACELNKNSFQTHLFTTALLSTCCVQVTMLTCCCPQGVYKTDPCNQGEHPVLSPMNSMFFLPVTIQKFSFY